MIIDPKKFKKEFEKLEKTEKDLVPDEAFLCPHCKSLFGLKVSRSSPSHLTVGKNGEPRKIICDGEKEFWLEMYYEDILKNIPLRSVPKETVLTQLYNLIEDENSKVPRYELESALIISDNQPFYSNLKCFVKKMVYEYHFQDFSYAVVNFSELRNMRLDKNESFANFDNRKLVVLDLTVSSHSSKLDGDIIKEFVYSRESKFLPLWVLNPDEIVSNKNVDDVNIRRKIQALRKVKIGAKKSSIQEIDVGSTEKADDKAEEKVEEKKEEKPLGRKKAVKKKKHVVGSDGQLVKD